MFFVAPRNSVVRRAAVPAEDDGEQQFFRLLRDGHLLVDADEPVVFGFNGSPDGVTAAEELVQAECKDWKPRGFVRAKIGALHQETANHGNAQRLIETREVLQFEGGTLFAFQSLGCLADQSSRSSFRADSERAFDP